MMQDLELETGRRGSSLESRRQWGEAHPFLRMRSLRWIVVLSIGRYPGQVLRGARASIVNKPYSLSGVNVYVPGAMNPNPPARETSLARRPPAAKAIGAEITGVRMPVNPSEQSMIEQPYRRTYVRTEKTCQRGRQAHV